MTALARLLRRGSGALRSRAAQWDEGTLSVKENAIEGERASKALS